MGTGLRLADLLGGLSLVADLGYGLPPQTAMRSCLIATTLARKMGLSEDDVRDCYYTALLMHIGCVGRAHEAAAAFGDDLALNRAVSRTNLADPADVVSTFLPELTRDMNESARNRALEFAFNQGYEWARQASTGSCEVARDTARRIGLPESTQRALHQVFEVWSGGWAPLGLSGDDIAIAARVTRAAADAAFFDQKGGADAAVVALRARAGSSLDPAVVAAFTKDPESVLREVNTGDPRDRILDVEPEPVIERSGTDLADVAAAFGDLSDLKTPFLHGHARDVARLAGGAARRLGLGSADVERVQVAARLHDVGRVGVSNAIWEKQGPLTRGEWEQVRMHGYHSERILATSPSLEAVSTTAGMHHERLDGSGYHRGSTVAGLPMPARIVAVADAFSAMTQPRPHRCAMDPEQAAGEITDEARAGRLDPDAASAVLAEAGSPVQGRIRAAPAGLSNREVEVLRLIAAGHSNSEVADRLFIARKTAQHHVQHIYNKIGVSTRAAAALFAVEHALVGPAP